jgi:hypothetical protein
MLRTPGLGFAEPKPTTSAAKMATIFRVSARLRPSSKGAPALEDEAGNQSLACEEGRAGRRVT